MRTVYIVVTLTLLLAPRVSSQNDGQRNLATCLSGKYPTLCNHAALTADQLRDVRAAEQRENLRVCMTGKFPSLCDHSRLNGSEAVSVKEAERAENLRVCSTGKYPALCRHEVLSAVEAAQVRSAELAENLRICLDGRYPSLCNHRLLTSQQAKDVSVAEARSAGDGPPASNRSQSPSRPAGGCETGHWIDSVGGDGKVIKLEDGSLWLVDDVDTITSAIWLPVTDVVICGAKMINVDDSESVSVSRLGTAAPGRGSPADSTTRGYVIQASANDETFVVNGEVFKAKTYCFDFTRGDRVIFVSGSAFGACTSAQLLNVRTGKICNAWCE